MKKFKFCILAGLLALLSVSAFAEGRLPANIQTAFQTLYPQATDVEWEQIGRLLRGRIYCRWSGN